jgi:predicted dehydrogenase
VSNNGTSFWQEDGYRRRDPILDTSSLNPVSIAMHYEAEDFVRVVRGDTSRSEASLADAVHAVEVVAAMVSSAETGVPVVVEGPEVPLCS